MANQSQACFDELQFNRFLESESDQNEEARIVAHIATCQTCQKTLEKLSGHQEIWSELKEHLAEESIDLPGEETRDLLETQDRNRDLKKIQDLLGPTDNPAMIGRLGTYEVCGMVGRGSAGVVVKALDPALNRYVAIKLLAPAYTNNGSSRRRFEREARAIASVKHPNVIPVHSVGEYQGTPYIVMQYVPDGSLLRRLELQGPLSTSEVVRVGMQIAHGLAAAHEQGIVHRDVKPANVLLERGVNSAMVTDFGLARVVDEATMTRSGAISGTPQFMSPEQAKGESVDPRSDLFSLGSVMYAACTGHSPFRAESVFGVIKRVCETEPRPIRESNPDVAEWLTALISKLQSKSREDRFNSADEVAQLLSQELAHLQSPTIVAKPNREWWVRPKKKLAFGFVSWKTAATALVAVAATCLGMFILNGLTSPRNAPSPALSPEVTANSGGIAHGPFSETRFSPEELLVITKSHNQELERFKQTTTSTIDVREGGQLFLRTNLGKLNVSTHDKSTVELTIVHTVAAESEEIANKIFKAVKTNYERESEEGQKAGLESGDALVFVAFPTRQLTEQEIQDSTDLEELKEQLQIRNNSHFRNAEFELLVPEKFSLDLQTSAGPINTTDVGGSAKLASHGGHIVTGSIADEAEVNTHGGHISVGDIGSDATLKTQGGHIEMGDVSGDLFALTHGGRISGLSIAGTVDAETHGGKVEFGEVGDSAKAKTSGGSIVIWKAHADVDANAPSGSIKINFVAQPERDSVLLSGSGAIKVGYVDGLGFDINATSGNGRVSGPFVENKSKKLRYQLNDGRVKLKATTGSGSVKFFVINEDEIDEQVDEMVEDVRGERAFQYAYELHMEGKIDEAIEAHKAAAKYESHKGIATYNLGCAWALKGETDKAFEALNEAVTHGFNDLGQFREDNDLDSLRKDDRWEELVDRIKGSWNENQLVGATSGEIGRMKNRAKSDYGKTECCDDCDQDCDEQCEDDEDEMEQFQMACIHAVKNELDLSFQYLNESIELGFDDICKMKNAKDLENLRTDDRFAELIKSIR